MTVDATNYFLVSLQPCLVQGRLQEGYSICIRNPAHYRSLSIEEALNLAAYLVALADPGGERFREVLEAVKNA